MQCTETDIGFWLFKSKRLLVLHSLSYLMLNIWVCYTSLHLLTLLVRLMVTYVATHVR